MQDKILKLLKDTVGKTSVNDRTLEAYAKIIAGKTKDEAQIEAEIDSYVELIKEFDGNINSVAKQAAIDKEEELQTKLSQNKDEVKPKVDNQTDDKQYLTLEDIQKILSEQEAKASKTKSFEKMVDEARSALLAKGLKPKLLGKLLNNITPSEDLSADVLVSNIQKEYDEIYSDVNPEAGKPKMAKLANGDQVPSGIADFLQRMQEKTRLRVKRKN